MLDQDIGRTQNIARPRNARRFGFKMPCAVRGDCCHDCASPDRICNALAICLRKLKSVGSGAVMMDEEPEL